MIRTYNKTSPDSFTVDQTDKSPRSRQHSSRHVNTSRHHRITYLVNLLNLSIKTLLIPNVWKVGQIITYCQAFGEIPSISTQPQEAKITTLHLIQRHAKNKLNFS